MNVDWVVAISVFLIFIGISFGLYWGLFEAKPETAGSYLEPVSQKILGFLQVDSWRIPVRCNSTQSGISVLYFDFQWPEGAKNSSRIFDSGLPLSCMLQGNRLYFQADVEEGDNDFDVSFANMSSPLLCDSVLDTGVAIACVPWASELSRSISQSKIDQMLATEYTQFRQSLGITRNFRVEVQGNSYGPQSPKYSNTYVKETRSLIQETVQPVTISVAVW